MKSKTVFCCSECGYETAKFLGKCPSCGAWNSFKEQKTFTNEKKTSLSRETSVRPMTLKEINSDVTERITMDISELDRVLGGGLVKGSLVLVGGEPGIGKSTLLMQVCQNVSEKGKILYVSGEESEMQLKMRAERLSVTGDNLLILPETDIDKALSFVDETECDVCIVDYVFRVCGFLGRKRGTDKRRNHEDNAKGKGIGMCFFHRRSRYQGRKYCRTQNA